MPRYRINRTTDVGSRIHDVISIGSVFRSRLAELLRIIESYEGDITLQTDTGLSAGDAALFTAALANAVAEMNATALQTVPAGQKTWVKRLLDALSTGG